MLQHDLVAIRETDEPEELWSHPWLLRRSGGAGRDQRRGGGCRTCAGAVHVQARAQDRVAFASANAQAALINLALGAQMREGRHAIFTREGTRGDETQS